MEVSIGKFSCWDNRPLLAVCADGSVSGGGNFEDAFATPLNGSTSNGHDPVNGVFMPTVVRFYSLRSQSYVHILKFRSAVYSVRCSTRVIAISQAAQIHCFDAATLEREYTLLTNPLVTGCSGFGGIGCGPLAVGPRWLAYSGSPVVNSNSGRVSPQHLTPSASFSGPASNGSLVAHYAKESSKQLAAGIVTLGDMGYKKLSRYYSELLPECNNAAQSGNPGWKVNGAVNGHLPDAENVGMVVVRDIVSKSVIAQFRAHKSPISSLCFDPSGTLLVTASVQGHNINVFRIMPELWGSSSGSDSGPSYVHIYRLQRGFTNAVIQDISFSDDSNWIMISSSRGTSHLFAISASGESVAFQSPDACFTGKNSGSGVMTKPAVRWPPNSGPQMLNQQNFCASGPPVTLSVVSRIRSGNNGWRSTVSGAAATATGRTNSLSGAIASAFHNCKGNNLHAGTSSLKALYHLLVFSPSGCVIQYALRASPGLESVPVVAGLGSYDSAPENDARNRKDPEMHEARIPLWAKPEIYFQSMIIDGVQIDGEATSGGEIEIERIPTRMIEARSKDLVPIFEYLQTPRFQQTRSSSGSLNSMTDGGAAVPELHGRIEETGWDGFRMPTEATKGFVNNNDNPKSNTRLEIVNNRDSSTREARIKFVT
ncbi:autophagy 18 F-like protein [Actinidia rufa]|uniref:Autophagy 18 F-like protein n=1 Tax=Actinidia rufa TaxID=165716 RepID=A0A7J0GNU7_9ERIC|nr:autophagy 18 F-like protein [Actinidia rufa]